jgi:hypothetical protein
VLDMGSTVITSRALANYYSRMLVYNDGRLRLSHTGGLYSGSATPGTLDAMISGNNRVTYYLYPTSIIEYYGSATAMVTGIPNGIATTNNHKYGILEINHTGTPGAAWVYPETDEEVFVRTELRLTSGELNLDNDHTTAGGGRTINIEAGGTITRTSGFIRSETEDGSGDLRWYITANGSYTIPFGFDNTEYIPFTFQQTSGSTGELLAATYRSLADNTPYPPTVNHVRDVFGVDNSAFTVDRFWKIQVTGNPVASLTYSFTNSEGNGIISPRAQLWEPITSGWFPPAGVQSNPTSTTTAAAGLSQFNSWWTLSALSSPLPIELISFEVFKSGTGVRAEWKTATEVNNDYFTLERSSDGTIFEPVETIQGGGTSSTPLFYSCLDKHPYSGISYYRLRQNDFDGRFTYSDLRTIKTDHSITGILYPNPAKASYPVTVELPAEELVSILVMDASGKIIIDEMVNGLNESKYSFNQIDNAGIYLVRIITPSTTFSLRLVVQN